MGGGVGGVTMNGDKEKNLPEVPSHLLWPEHRVQSGESV